MHGYVPRQAEARLTAALARSPVVAILGARQCGKSTLARQYLQGRGLPYTLLDLGDRADRNRLSEPELFLPPHRGELVCLDEVQRTPEIFAYLRVEVDRDRRPGRFLILGSASRDLLRQSTETLAGRIAFLELTPFTLDEVHGRVPWQRLWTRGGFPESVLAATEEASYGWRLDFIRTFLERDIPQLGFAAPATAVERLWRLLAHYHGETLNLAKVAGAADLTVPALKRWLGLLEQTYMLRLLPPAEPNLKKRLTKSPKAYLRDSGLLHALRDIESYDDLLAHPINGTSWEGWVIENLVATHPRWRPSFVRTSNGAEVDLLMERGTRRVLIECKLSKAPTPSRGFRQLLEDLQPEAAWLVAPVDDPYTVQAGIRVAHLPQVRLDG